MIYSYSPFGYEGTLVNVEVDLREGISAIDVTGYADNRVPSLRGRVRISIDKQGFTFPEKRVLISLTPSDIFKEGTGFDLPCALEVLLAQAAESDTYDKETVSRIMGEKVFVMGELDLKGKVRNVDAVNAGLSTAKASGIEYAIVPASDELEIPEGMKVTEVRNLRGAWNSLWKLGDRRYFTTGKNKAETNGIEFPGLSDMEKELDNLDVMKGLKYAMTVAVAGRHHIMAWGSPGCGKTLVLNRIGAITPKLSNEEKKSVERIFSLTGLNYARSIVKTGTRIMRMPHQTIGIEGMCGGGPNCRPGEISLAHNGILFLDEAAEYRTSVLQMLRVPLETKNIMLSRAGRCTTYPADFQLVMTSNPCPCGNYGSKDRICLCSAKSIEQYWRKFSQPLLDRIGIRYNCNEDDTEFPELKVEEMQKRIKRAWERQYARQGKLNEALTGAEINEHIVLTNGARNFLERETALRNLSPRAEAEIRKVAQTLLDMEENPKEQVTELEMQLAIRLCGRTPLDGLEV